MNVNEQRKSLQLFYATCGHAGGLRSPGFNYLGKEMELPELVSEDFNEVQKIRLNFDDVYAHLIEERLTPHYVIYHDIFCPPDRVNNMRFMFNKKKQWKGKADFIARKFEKIFSNFIFNTNFQVPCSPIDDKITTDTFIDSLHSLALDSTEPLPGADYYMWIIISWWLTMGDFHRMRFPDFVLYFGTSLKMSISYPHSDRIDKWMRWLATRSCEYFFKRIFVECNPYFKNFHIVEFSGLPISNFLVSLFTWSLKGLKVVDDTALQERPVQYAIRAKNYKPFEEVRKQPKYLPGGKKNIYKNNREIHIED